MNETDKQQLLTELREGVVTVSFTKINGDRRDMQCTLKEDMLPEVQANNNAPEGPKGQSRKPNPDVQSVWDVDQAAWRSFRWENVITDEG